CLHPKETDFLATAEDFHPPCFSSAPARKNRGHRVLRWPLCYISYKSNQLLFSASLIFYFTPISL
ncbi:MAG: hypothetical protein SPL49_04420, partial [Oribacterium sp.]|nr:hypothetical protein [Oribacterium sp.]